MSGATWLCCQLGAREHFAIPRALQRSNKLGAVLTDVWIKPTNPLAVWRSGLRGRFHPELASAPLHSWTAQSLINELGLRIRGLSSWQRIISRNRWFQRRVCRQLWRLHAERLSDGGSKRFPPVLFSYSYTALAPFQTARRFGWRTVLGQIDPGPPEERLVGDIGSRLSGFPSAWTPAPAEYWRDWREECDLAEAIIVNSAWSRTCLEAEGIPGDKIVVVPLAYETDSQLEVKRSYPEAFTRTRPLSVLFLGQAIIRKGIHDLLRAAEILLDDPVAITIVGSGLQDLSRIPPNVEVVGQVSRSEAVNWYRQADIFVLPTHSDGFALTQLEAMAHGLPVIATDRCGAVVEAGRSGWIIEAGSIDQLVFSIRHAVYYPAKLSDMSANVIERARQYSIARLTRELADVEKRLRH